MRERPILFKADMVGAVLDGRKTQTRRIIQSPAKNMQASGHKVIEYREPGDKWYGEHVFSMRNQSGTWCDYTKEQFLAKCPFGAVGDRLWVRETFRVHSRATDVATLVYKASEQQSWTQQTHRVPIQKCNKPAVVDTWTPSIHMPRCASRITLEITGVRVERLQDISEEDALAEGVIPEPCDHIRRSCEEIGCCGDTAKGEFGALWKSIYDDDNWQTNPWVWVVEFERVEVD
ncbi:RNA-binding protein [Pantoea phage AH07]|nr:RNA-binding protein [Pantoea phage AH07]